MRIIFHMGTPKTGSTSLQRGLENIRDELIANGFFYIDGPNAFPKFNNMAAAFSTEFELLQPFLRKRFKTPDNMLTSAKGRLQDAVDQAKYNSCHTLIISSEISFPHQHKKRDMRSLYDQLREYSSYIQSVVYVREPADYYRSTMQQLARGRKFLAPIDSRQLRRPLELIEDAFDRSPNVRVFCHEQLLGNDIMHDFCRGVLGLQHFESSLPKFVENASLSAEATHALLRYGQFLSALGQDITGEYPAFIGKQIVDYPDPENKLTPLKLKPALVKAIRQSAVEYVWLNKKFGLKFKELEYDKITPEAIPHLEQFDTPNKIFEWDREKELNILLAMKIIPNLQDLHDKQAGKKKSRFIDKYLILLPKEIRRFAKRFR